MKLFNTENLQSVHWRSNYISKQIDDAEWMGDFETADFLKLELKELEDLKEKGEVWYPMF